MSVVAKLDELQHTLDRRTEEVAVLLEAAYALGLEIDMAQMADDKGRTRSCASAVTALRGVVADLIAKGRTSAGSEADTGDWTAPVTPIRSA